VGPLPSSRHTSIPTRPDVWIALTLVVTGLGSSSTSSPDEPSPTKPSTSLTLCGDGANDAPIQEGEDPKLDDADSSITTLPSLSTDTLNGVVRPDQLAQVYWREDEKDTWRCVYLIVEVKIEDISVVRAKQEQGNQEVTLSQVIE